MTSASSLGRATGRALPRSPTPGFDSTLAAFRHTDGSSGRTPLRERSSRSHVLLLTAGAPGAGDGARRAEMATRHGLVERQGAEDVGRLPSHPRYMVTSDWRAASAGATGWVTVRGLVEANSNLDSWQEPTEEDDLRKLVLLEDP